ncbi:MAG: caspase domain-containing protein [Candidatus Methanomethylophilaceae archaeon]
MLKKRALVIGIDDYPDGSKLHGCVNDASTIANLLEYNGDKGRNFDVKKPNITNQNDLKTNIEELFEGKGDVALLYFAGHGMRNTEGGYLVTPDYSTNNPGVSMTDLASIMSNSKWTSKVAILDCCNAGAMGDFTSAEETCILKDGMTIMSACDRDESATERNGHGIFTDLLIDGLKGGAADLSGSITPGSLYAYVDKSLGAWSQRPIFKTNVSNFICLRKVAPPVDRKTLSETLVLFKDPDSSLRLDPSFEFTNSPDYKNELKEPYCTKENVEKLKTLQKLERVGLVVPVNEEHMYFAAMNSESCKLTPLGKYYWKLAKEGRL